MADTVKANHEPRMMIDGELVEADSGKTFENVNPATEEVLGQVADASTDGHASRHRRGPPGVRRDELVHRPRLPQALPRSSSRRRSRREQEELREELILEVGCPRMLTHGPQLDAPLADALRYPIEAHRRATRGRPSFRDRPDMRGTPDQPADLEGAGRRRRRHHAVELPVRGHGQQARPGAGHRQHGGAQAGARHAVERHPHRPARRRAHRHPRRRRERRHLVGPPRRRGAHAVAARSTSSPSPARRPSASGSWRRAPPR